MAAAIQLAHYRLSTTFSPPVLIGRNKSHGLTQFPRVASSVRVIWRLVYLWNVCLMTIRLVETFRVHRAVRVCMGLLVSHITPSILDNF